MKKIVSVLLSAAMLLSAATVAFAAEDGVFTDGYKTDSDLGTNAIEAPAAWGAVPNDAQRYYQQQGLAAFCHFGPNTYWGIEWGESYGDTDPEDLFCLPEDQSFDADTIVKTMKEAGFSRILLTCKHHDGFALWDCSDVYEKYGLEPYTVMQSSYKRDLLEELSDACTKYNMDMGIYLSPWDIHLQNEGVFGSYLTSDGWMEEKVNKTVAAGNGEQVDTNAAGEYLTYQNVYNAFYLDQLNDILYSVKTDENGNTLYVTDENGDYVLDENGEKIPQYKYGNNSLERRTSRFVEVWMDGATGTGAAPQYYDWASIVTTVRADNPECLVFGTHAPGDNGGSYLDNTDDKIFDEYVNAGGVHWIGNEYGYASSTTWSKLNGGPYGYENTSVYPRDNGAIVGQSSGSLWSVPEVDTKILEDGWFWSASKQSSLRSESELAQIYFDSVGHGATLLLNMSPNTDGTLDEAQLERFVWFGQAIQSSFETDFTKEEGVTAAASSVYGNNIAYSASNVLDSIPDGQQYDETYWAPASGKTGSIEINFGELKSFDCVSLEEYTALGQRISEFNIEYKTVAGEWKTFGEGTTVGAKRLVRSSVVTATAIRVNITDSAADIPMLSNVGVFKLAEGFETEASGSSDQLITDLENFDYTAHTSSVKTGSWQSSSTAGEKPHAWSTAAGSTMTYTFTGSQFAVEGIVDPGHCIMRVNLDGEDIADVDLNVAEGERTLEKIVYVSDPLDYGEHTVKLTAVAETVSGVVKTAIDIHGIYYFGNAGGVVSIEEPSYKTVANSDVTVKVVRRYASSEAPAVNVNYATATGSAEQNVQYEYQNGTLSFAKGETEKEVTVKTIYNENRGGNETFFYFTLSSAAENSAVIGEPSASQVFIEPLDLDLTKEQLEDAVAEGMTKAPADYNPEEYALFRTRLANARAVLADPGAAPADIAAAIQSLEMASEALTLKDGVLSSVTGLTASAPSEHSGEEASKAVDGDPNTNWHTLWAGESGTKPDFATNTDNHMIITLPEEKTIAKVTYLPKQSASYNGTVTKAEILVSTEASGDDWVSVAIADFTCDMETDHSLQTVTFAPVKAKRVMFRALETLADSGSNLYISAAEVEVFEANVTSALGDANCDGSVDGNDVTAILKHCVKLTPEDFDFIFSDANNDLTINVKDATAVQKRLVAAD